MEDSGKSQLCGCGQGWSCCGAEGSRAPGQASSVGAGLDGVRERGQRRVAWALACASQVPRQASSPQPGPPAQPRANALSR